MSVTPFARRVRSIVRRVPCGRVVAYGTVAALAGAPGAARAVGRVMRTLPDGTDVPWWRVINAGGTISARPTVHGARVQRALLEAEGLRFDRAGRIDWARHGWDPRSRSDPDDAPRPTTRRSGRKRSVALVIHEPGATGRILLVRRPPDDPDLPLVWGLPAASLHPGESWEDAARRAAREKLDIIVRLRRPRASGSTSRPHGSLAMRLFDATRARGTPDLDRTPPGVTRYVAWRWGPPEDLRPGAERGSLCCRLALDSAP